MKKIISAMLFAVLAAPMFTSCEKDGGKNKPATYSITMSADANGSAEATVDGTAVTTAAAGATVTITATPTVPANYAFKQWVVQIGGVTLSGTTTNPATFTMPAAAVSIKAEFEPVLYGVTISADDNGSAEATVDGNAVTTADVGATVTITATPTSPTEYRFKQWVAASGTLPDFVTGSATASPATFTMPAAAVSIKAEFELGVLIDGIVWAPYNVDAFGTFAATPESPGMFYQWNRTKAWAVTGTITGWDKTTPTGDSWAAANDPCPTGWRVPTKAEQETLLNADNVDKVWTTQNGVNGYLFTDITSGAAIFLSAAGVRGSTVGTLGSVGDEGYCWSGSSDSTDKSWYLYFHSRSIIQGSTYSRASGFSVRCVRQ